MSTLDEAREHYLSRHTHFAGELGDEPSWLGQLRAEALTSFSERGLPHRKLEEWRYTNIAPLAQIPFEVPGAGTALPAPEVVAGLSPCASAGESTIFVDGHLASALSVQSVPSGGVEVESIAEQLLRSPQQLEPHLGRSVDVKLHPFAALNTAFLDDGASVRVPAGCEVGAPLRLVFVAERTDTPRVCHPRVAIAAGENSRATIVLDFVARGSGKGLTNAVVEVSLERNAHVDLIVLQRESGEHFHVSNLAVRQERDSRFAAYTLSLAGRLVRNDASVVLAGEGAECVLNGLFVGSERQLVDNHTTIDHAVPHGTSSELYKGILTDRARGVFRGRVIVRPDAQKTNALQSNPNLLLGERAEIDTKPQLEIYADDVKCSHGSTVGQLDEAALFYLRSRGIAESGARQLLTRAFAAEILEALPVPALTEALAEELMAHLRGSGAGR